MLQINQITTEPITIKDMREDIKKEWVAALRSGDYKQGKYALRVNCENPEYCCLGVLTDLLIKRDGNLVWEATGRFCRPMRLDTNRSGNTVSLDLGLRIASGLDPSDEINLSKLNDRGTPFGMIADYIESYL